MARAAFRWNATSTSDDRDGPERGDRTRHLQDVEKGAMRLLRRGGQDEEVDREEGEDGEQVEQPLDHDGREARARRDAVAARDQVGPQDLRRARDHEPGEKPDHGDRKKTRQRDLAQGGEEKAPPPGPYPVGRHADEEQPGQGGEVGLAQGPEQGGPLHAPENERRGVRRPGAPRRRACGAGWRSTRL